MTKAGDYRVFFGWRSDPFFFDANGLFNNMQFTGDDFFAAKNICSIAIELPNSSLGTDMVGLWARTLDKTGEGWIQADRGGRPLQAVFLPGEAREAHLNGEPAADERFVGAFALELEHSGGYRFFSMLTNGKVTEDKVGPHGDLLDEFPYLGPPHDSL